jgi:hypothetical protein
VLRTEKMGKQEDEKLGSWEVEKTESERLKVGG